MSDPQAAVEKTQPVVIQKAKLTFNDHAIRIAGVIIGLFLSIVISLIGVIAYEMWGESERQGTALQQQSRTLVRLETAMVGVKDSVQRMERRQFIGRAEFDAMVHEAMAEKMGKLQATADDIDKRTTRLEAQLDAHLQADRERRSNGGN